nr:MAG TPA: hypothetical protein [Microviridae sp.]
MQPVLVVLLLVLVLLMLCLEVFLLVVIGGISRRKWHCSSSTLSNR